MKTRHRLLALLLGGILSLPASGFAEAPPKASAIKDIKA
jgi:hypothetical protein